MKITRNPEEGTILEIEDDKILVRFITIGEGYYGDYDPDVPDDAELIRFDVCAKGIEGFEDEWTDVEDASFCTSLEVDTPIEELEDKIKIIFSKYRSVHDQIVQGFSARKIGEELSWI